MRSTDHALIERVALETLDQSIGPVGSSRLMQELSRHGIEIAEATAGRFLRSLDRAGFTQPKGKLGRVLTEDGRLRLKQIHILQRQGEQSSVLVGAATPTDVDELIDLLHVRRAVEPEAARHAALRANDAERAAIREAADSHVQFVNCGTDHSQVAIDFHRLVAHASHNKMLSAVASLVVDPINDQLAMLLESISVEAGVHFISAHEHRDIVQAIEACDADAAEDAMRRHIDDLIAVVEHYRERFGVHNGAFAASRSS